MVTRSDVETPIVPRDMHVVPAESEMKFLCIFRPPLAAAEEAE